MIAVETYFVTRCVRTPNIEREIEICLFWSRRVKLLFLFCFLFTLAGCVFLAKGGNISGSILSAVLTGIIFFSYFGLPRSSAKRTYHEMCKLLHTDKPENLASFSNEQVEWLAVQTGGKVTFRYIQFTECIELKHLFLLTAAPSEGHPALTIILPKAGFESGKSNDFTGFLKEKCPGMKFCSAKCL